MKNNSNRRRSAIAKNIQTVSGDKVYKIATYSPQNIKKDFSLSSFFFKKKGQNDKRKLYFFVANVFNYDEEKVGNPTEPKYDTLDWIENDTRQASAKYKNIKEKTTL